MVPRPHVYFAVWAIAIVTRLAYYVHFDCILPSVAILTVCLCTTLQEDICWRTELANLCG